MIEQWEDITPAGHPDELRIRRVDPDHPLDFYYGRDFKGGYVFIYKGRLPGRDLPKVPKLAGIGVHLEGTVQGDVELHLRLPDPAQADIFKALCMNLMAATRSLEKNSDDAGIEIILARLRRWHELLKSGRDKLLSQSEIIGLCGELLLLRDMFMPRLTPADAVASWRGPFGDEQDFLLGGVIVEVKTQLSTSDRKLRISSVDQLDTVSGEIFICHQTLGVGENGKEGVFSLNSLVAAMLESFKKRSSAAADILYGALIEYGYMQRSEYDEPHFVLICRNFYAVIDDFPALRASMIPAGITDVRYSIMLDACLPFSTGEKEVFRALFK